MGRLQSHSHCRHVYISLSAVALLLYVYACLLHTATSHVLLDGEPPCNASWQGDVGQYAQTLSTWADTADVTGILIDFELWTQNASCLESVESQNISNTTHACNSIRVYLNCPAAYANLTLQLGLEDTEGNATTARRYFNPLQQLWSRKSDPTPILTLPPDRVALSFGLLSDDHLKVRHLPVKLEVSSLECWQALNHTVQSRITRQLTVSMVDGLAAPGLHNGTAQLCQLRYAAKSDYALFSDAGSGSNEEFAFTCCSAEAANELLICSSVSSVSRWYDGNSLVIVWGVVVALLLCPLPFMSELTPSTPVKKPGGYQAVPMSASPMNLTVQADDDDESHHDLPMETRPQPSPPPEGVSHPAEQQQALLCAPLLQPVSWKNIASSFWHGQPHRYFVENTGAQSHVPITPFVMMADVWQTHHVVDRLLWLVMLMVPLGVLALRAVAYRVSSFNSMLSCMIKLNVASPWFLFESFSDYILLIVFIVLGLVCLLANPDNAKAKLQQSTESTGVLFPSRPSGFHVPASGGSHPGLIQHILSVYKKYSLIVSIYRSHMAGASGKEKTAWTLVCIVAAIPDFFLLVAVGLLTFVYNTPTGFALIRWSMSAGSSVSVFSQHPDLNMVLGWVVSVSWFTVLTSLFLLLLLLATWIISTVQFTIVGLVYSLSKYLDAVIQISAFVLYLRHYFQQIQAKYNRIQTSVIAHFHKIENEQKLVKSIAAAVKKELAPAADGTATAGDSSALHIPTMAFHDIVTQVYPVRYVVLKTLLSFLGVCIYLAALNATLMMTGKLQKYSAFGKSVVLAVGSALPKIVEYLTSDAEDENRKMDTHVEQTVRKTFATVV